MKLLKKLQGLLLVLFMVLALGQLSNEKIYAEGNVAKVGDTEYATLQGAIDAVQDNQTITLLSDIALDSIVKIHNDKTFTIDGANYTISASANSSLTTDFIRVGSESQSHSPNVTIKDLTIKGYNLTADYAALIRCEYGQAALSNVTFENNTTANNIIIVRNSSLTVNNCTFKSNTASDAQNAGVIYTDEANSSVTITNSLFESNTENSNGLINIAANCTGTIKNNTFKSNTVGVSSTENTAIIYGSGIIDVENNLFELNTINAKDSKKLAPIVLGSGSAGNGTTTKSIVRENAFVNNIIDNASANYAYGVYTGHAKADLTANYWVDGTEPDWAYKESGKDIYVAMDSGFTAPETYADDYTVNSNGRGVTVSISYVAQIGETKYMTFEKALEVANATSGATIELLKDYAYKTNGTGLWNIASSMTIDGNGHTLSGYGARGDNKIKDTFAINNGGTNPIYVTIKNLTITNEVDYGRPIDIRGSIDTLVFDDVTLNANGDSSQIITYGGNHPNKVNIELLNGTYLNGGEATYAIITFNPVNWTIDQTAINAWSCMYFKVDGSSVGSSGSVVNATNSTFYSQNVHGGNSNSFATFVMEDDNITLNLTDCDISATMTNISSQFAFTASSWSSRSSQQATINVHTTDADSNKTKVKEWLFRNEWGSTAKLVVDGGIYFEDPSEYVAEGYIVIPNEDSSTKEAYPYRVVPVGNKAVAKIEYTYDEYVINPSDKDDKYIDIYYYNDVLATFKDENGNLCPHYALITDTTPYYNSDKTQSITAQEVYDFFKEYSGGYYLRPSLRTKKTITSSVIYASVEGAADVAQYVTDNSESTCAITLLKTNNSETFTLPVDTMFDTKGLVFNGTIYAPDGYAIKHSGTIYSVVVASEAPEIDSNAQNTISDNVVTPDNAETDVPNKVADIVINDMKRNTAITSDEASDIQNVVNGLDIDGAVNNSAQLKITIKSAVSTTTATTVSDVSTTTITTTKATYDVKPYVTIETTSGGVTTTETRLITNSELAANNVTIAFRLAVPKTMTGSVVTVSHYEDGATTADWTKNYNVQTADNGDRYIELSASSFSVYELKQYVESSNGNGGGSYKAPKTCVE